MKKVYLTAMVTVLSGILFGIISLYWLTFCIAASFNVFADDIGAHPDEYTFLVPFGIIGLILYLVIVFIIGLKMIKKPKIFVIFLASSVLSAVLGMGLLIG